MSMNLNLEIDGIHIDLWQTPTEASYKIYVPGNDRQTARNYVDWVKSLYNEKRLRETVQELTADYHRLMNLIWADWEDGDPEPTLTIEEYMKENHPFYQAEKIVTLVEEALKDDQEVDFYVM